MHTQHASHSLINPGYAHPACLPLSHKPGLYTPSIASLSHTRVCNTQHSLPLTYPGIYTTLRYTPPPTRVFTTLRYTPLITRVINTLRYTLVCISQVINPEVYPGVYPGL